MEVIAFPRSEQGSGASRRLRRAGQTPGIIYGGTSAPVSVTLDHNALFHALKKEAFHSSILDLKIDGVSEKVVLRDFQVHAYKALVLHVDFQRVDANQKLHVKVPLHFINGDIAPVVKLSGGVISHVLNELDVSCLPADLPEFIEVDLSSMQDGGSFHVSDMKLPEGVVAVHAKDNPTIATATIPRGAKSDATEAEGDAKK
jgi:large subunit ribosomal protein L25